MDKQLKELVGKLRDTTRLISSGVEPDKATKMVFEERVLTTADYRNIGVYIDGNVELYLRQLLHDLSNDCIDKCCKHSDRFLFQLKAFKTYKLEWFGKSKRDWCFKFVDTECCVDNLQYSLTDLSLENKLTLIDIIENSL